MYSRINNTLLIILSTISLNVFCVETIYYGDLPKNIEINSKDSMLLMLPSAPLSANCQPAGVVELNIVESERDLQISAIAQNPTLADVFLKKEKQEQGGKSRVGNPIEKVLKLQPILQEKDTMCSISISNGEVITLKFHTKEGVYRPLVKLKNSITTENSIMSVELNYLDLFRDFVRGKSIKKMQDQTGDVEDSSITTKKAKYKLIYLGNDFANYKAWIFEVKLKEDMLEQISLSNGNVGDYYISSLLRDDISKKGTYSKDGNYKLYILTKNSVSPKEIMGRLP